MKKYSLLDVMGLSFIFLIGVCNILFFDKISGCIALTIGVIFVVYDFLKKDRLL
jgi:hypothetical protein